MFKNMPWNYVISIQDICTRNMLPINILDLVLHRGATMTIHVDYFTHLLLVLLASMVVVAGSSLPRA